jgi:hypothetical protein
MPDDPRAFCVVVFGGLGAIGREECGRAEAPVVRQVRAARGGAGTSRPRWSLGHSADDPTRLPTHNRATLRVRPSACPTLLFWELDDDATGGR